MKKTALLLLYLASCMDVVFSQDTKAQTQQAAMQQLRWLTGRWTGKSEVTAPGNRQLVNVQEIITPMLNGTIFTVSARGTAYDSANNKMILVYNSFGVISYNVKEKQYHWRTWRNPGDSFDDAVIKTGENSFEYTTAENGGFMRYKAKLNDNGQWTETGELSTDRQSWGQFATMTLTKRH